MENFSRFDIFALLILLGVFQGFFIAWFLLKKKHRQQKKNLFLGLFSLALSGLILEVLLSYTGVMTKVIYINDFSEPLNFAIGPLFFFTFFYSIHPDKKLLHWPHFIWFVFYALYLVFYFVQPNELKYNSFLRCYHPKAQMLPVTMTISEDPMGIRGVVNQLTLFHFVGYLFASAHYLLKEYRAKGKVFWSLKRGKLNTYRWFIIHFLIIILVFIFVKVYFGRDLGDYFIASYIAFILYLISFSIVNRSGLFKESTGAEKIKYEKSGLDDDLKNDILRKLETVLQEEGYYKTNLASLVDISSKINETTHNVSQVINEKTGMNFFNWLASYRIEEAKKILSGNDAMKFKIEEIAEMVGYNSKASFNKAFKNITGQTPSEYRKLMQTN